MGGYIVIALVIIIVCGGIFFVLLAFSLLLMNKYLLLQTSLRKHRESFRMLLQWIERDIGRAGFDVRLTGRAEERLPRLKKLVEENAGELSDIDIEKINERFSQMEDLSVFVRETEDQLNLLRARFPLNYILKVSGAITAKGVQDRDISQV